MALLSIKLGSAANMPTQQMHALLEKCGEGCRIASIRAMKHWQAYWEEHGEPDVKYWWTGDDDNSLAKGCYRAAVDAAPYLNTKIASSALKRTQTTLGTKVQYNRDVTSQWRWQAILRDEDNTPFWRSRVLLLPNQDCRLGYLGMANKPGGRIMAYDDHAMLYIPLLSNRAPEETKWLQARLLVSDLSMGNRAIVRHVANPNLPEWKMSDSQLVCDNGKYILRLIYKQPDPEPREGSCLEIVPSGPKAANPLTIKYPEGGHWQFGYGRLYETEMNRLGNRERIMKWKRSFREGGHGRGHVYEKIKPLTRRAQNMRDTIVKQMISTVLKQAQKHECGEVLFREPSLGLRNYDWYAIRKLTFPWDSFAKRLEAKLKAHGITLRVEQMKKAEWDAKYSEAT